MREKKKKSCRLFEALSRITPGGVNSPFRSFREVNAPTLVFSHGKGSRVWDADGTAYIDYLGAWGPAILGHAHPDVLQGAREGMRRSPVLGLSTELELEMGLLVREAFPSMEMIRFVNSGAEAVECAIRLARGATGRSRIMRFEGGYHGHGDSVLWTYGPEEGRDPRECGVPAGLASETLYATFNDSGSVANVFESQGDAIAALLVEPVSGSMGVIEPRPGFLQSCRSLADRHGAVLIFDEVLTGFRVAFGGAQERYGVAADLTCLGKILGGGFPAGGYGGKRALMQKLAPLGPVYQAGTFCGNPVTMSAGRAVLKRLQSPGMYRRLEEKTLMLLSGLKKAAERSGIPVQMSHAGSMFSVLFSETPVSNYRESLKIDVGRYIRFFKGMLREGILFPPSATDAAVLSIAHSQEDIEETVKSASRVFREMRDLKKEI